MERLDKRTQGLFIFIIDKDGLSRSSICILRIHWSIFLLLIAINSSHSTAAGIVSESLFGFAFPPVKTEAERFFTKTQMNELGVRRIRINENWAYREKLNGVFDWTSFDKRLSWAKGNNFQIMLTIPLTSPNRYCLEGTSYKLDKSYCIPDKIAFTRFLSALLHRIKSKEYPVVRIQFGNEWARHLANIDNFSHRYSKLFNQFYGLSKRYLPETKVVIGSLATGVSHLWPGCAGYMEEVEDRVEGITLSGESLSQYCNLPNIRQIRHEIDYVFDNTSFDLLDLHLYSSYSHWPSVVDAFRDRYKKPIIISEFGGPNIERSQYSDQYQASELGKYIISLNKSNILEAYYFSLIELKSATKPHKKSGLFRLNFLNKPIVKASFDVFKLSIL
ncbi:MAG: hypothetical protein KUG78_22010 [Kangiellaceae bacterium]|nr:hypothetical protein [Kangiellaceae bacterium]